MNRRPVESLPGKLVAFYTPKHGYRVAKIRRVDCVRGELRTISVTLAGNKNGKNWAGAAVRLPVQAAMWPNMSCVGIEFRRRIYPLAEFTDAKLPEWSYEWLRKYYGKTRRSRCDSPTKKPPSGAKR
jgi:hypothetical protein